MKTILAAVTALVFAVAATAQEAKPTSVSALHQNKTTLAGKSVQVKGKVVKVNNGIMGRNFVHVQDGTGAAADGSNNLIVTSRDTANVGDTVTATGMVVLNRDFGMGYMYPLLLEESRISK